jgi:hypothetical protein
MKLPSVGSTSFDVLQDGGDVLVRDDGRRTLRRVDVPERRFTRQSAGLPAAAPSGAGVTGTGRR